MILSRATVTNAACNYVFLFDHNIYFFTVDGLPDISVLQKKSFRMNPNLYVPTHTKAFAACVLLSIDNYHGIRRQYVMHITGNTKVIKDNV